MSLYETQRVWIQFTEAREDAEAYLIYNWPFDHRIQLFKEPFINSVALGGRGLWYFLSNEGYYFEFHFTKKSLKALLNPPVQKR